MKSKLVKEFKEKGIKQIGGKKLESYSFYVLCGIWKRMFVYNEDIK